MSHARSKDPKKKPAAKSKAAKAAESRPQTGADKRLSPFYATGPTRTLAAPGPKTAARTPAAGVMAKKVAVSQPGDRYEREADAVAEKVTRGAPAPQVSRLPAGGLAQRKEEEPEKDATAQAKESEGKDEIQQKTDEDAETAQAKENEEKKTETAPANAQAQEASPETAGEEKTKDETVQQKEATAGETKEKKEEEPASEPAAQTLIQRQANASKDQTGEEKTGEEEMPAQTMAEKGEEETAQTKSEEDEEPVQQQVEEEEEEVQELSSREEARGRKKAAAGRAIEERGSGEPLSPATRSSLEAGLGADLSGVRVHHDGRAQEAARDMGARAFTHKNHIWLGPGESASDTKLMAHEATHVLQQGGAAHKPPARAGGASARAGAARSAGHGSAPGAAPGVQRKPAAGAGGARGTAAKGAPPATGDVAPEELELLGQTEVPASEPVASWLQGRKRRRGPVPVRFGQMAKGEVEMEADGKGRLRIRKKEAIPLQHELFRRIGDAAPELAPSLIFEEGRKVSGYLGLKAGKGLPSSRDLQRKLAEHPVLLGIPGFELPKLARAKSLSKIEGGHLEYGIEETPVSFGALFGGSIGFQGRDDKITSFSGRLAVHAQGLAEGELELRRDTTGKVAGKASVGLQLPKGFSGGVTVEWADDAVSGKGEVGYKGEKLSGTVTLVLMDKEKAAQLEEEKKAPPEGAEEPAAAPAEGRSKKGKKSQKKGKQEFVVFGEGDLDFEFTDWLHGTAHVIVDPEGHVTIIGKITPQKEYELFPQKDYEQKIFEVEPRLTYGLPVIGNIFIFANVSLRAFATIGPAKLYNIQVDGTYSTDPETMQSFSIQGTLNMSAAAGLKLRGEAGAGITILRHSVKAGAGLTGIAQVRGYAEATPIIGYREKPAGDGTDKKGEFYISGDLEIAAQPSLGLKGDLFIELDSPWWSPAPDKTWTWPLGDLEYPIGGSIGVGASVDYVFGSGKWPTVTPKKVDFSAEKFMSDLYHDKTQPKSGEPGEKKGAWKEKNQKALEPPPKEQAAAGGMTPGKAPEAPPPKPKEVPKKKGKAATPDARTAEGKTVKQLKKEAARKDPGQVKKTAATGAAAAGAPGEPKAPQGQDMKKAPAQGEQEPAETRWERVKAVVQQALDFAHDKGITKDELDRILKSIRRQKQFGLKSLTASEDPKKPDHWVVLANINPSGAVAWVRKASDLLPSALVYKPKSGDRSTLAKGEPLTKKDKTGSPTKRDPSFPKWWADVNRLADKTDWRRLHLIHDEWGRGDEAKNLAPGNTAANSAMYTLEQDVIARTNKNQELWYKVRVEYRTDLTYLTYGDYFPEKIHVSYGGFDRSKPTAEANVLQPEKEIEVKKPAPPGRSTIPTINDSGEPTLNDILKKHGLPTTLARWLAKESPFDGRRDLFKRLREAAATDHPSFADHEDPLRAVLDLKPSVLKVK